MIDAKEAVQKAVEYVREFHDYLPSSEIRLEETEFVDPEPAFWLITLLVDSEPAFWLITLSFAENAPAPQNRTYRTFRINAETGDVLSMKVRSLTPAQ